MAELVLLGTKGGPSLRLPGVSFLPSASHLTFEGRSIVIDCGLGITASMVLSGLSLTDLTDVFITHYHSDHVLELGGLLHTAWTTGLSHPIEVYGPAGLAKIWDNFCKMMAFDIDTRIRDEGRIPINELVKINAYDAVTSCPVILVDDGRLRVRALRNHHRPVDDSFALRFDADQKSITFSGDTSYFPSLAGFARNSDLLVHEAMLKKGIDFVLSKTKTNDNKLKKHLFAAHTFANEAGKIAKTANAGHLILNHLIPPERDICGDDDWKAEVWRNFKGKCSIGYDGMKIVF